MTARDQVSPEQVQPAEPARRRGRSWTLLAWIPALLAATFYAPLLAGVYTFPDGDFTHHFLPFSLFQHDALRRGALPVWNPYTYGGHPFLADVQAAVFYPVSNLILLVTLPIEDAAARLYLLQVEAVAHVALAGSFMALLVTALTGRRAAGLVAGVSFAFSGYLTGYPPLQLAVLRTAIWLPLILWCVLRAWTARRGLLWWSGAGGTLALAFLAGHPQTFLYIVYALAAWLALLAGVNWKRRPQVMRGLIGSAWMAVVAAGLSAAQWLPSVEFMWLSVRADVSYAFVSGGFPLQDSWQLLLPGALTHYAPLYIGVVGLQLAFCALVWAVFGRGQAEAIPPVSGLPWRVGVGFFAGMAVVGLLASYGGNGPLYPLLYRIAPGWNLFRGQERAAYWVAVGLSILAGYGAALIPLVVGRWRQRAAIWSGAVTVAGVYAFGLLWQLVGRSAIGNGAYLWVAAWTLIAGMAAALMVWLPSWSRRRTVGLILLATATLFVANWDTNLDRATPRQKVQPAPEIAALQHAVAEGHAGEMLPSRIYNEYRVYDNYGMRTHLEDVWGSSPLRLARYARLFENFPLDRMWRLLGVEYVLTWRRELFGPTELLAEFPQAEDTTYLHRLPEAGRRGWAVERVQVVDDDATWDALADHQVDLDEVALLSDALDAGLVDGASRQRVVSVARVADNRLRVVTQDSAPGFVMIAENWMPGWRVVDVTCEDVSACAAAGEPGGMLYPLRANLTLVGVAVPAGEAQFDLVYAPDSVRLGLVISGATLLLLAAMVGAAGWRRGNGDQDDRQPRQV